MPALEALVDRFETEADTQVAGISVDTRHSHANWAWDMGGVSFPLLSDFHPHGEVSRKYGVYLENAGHSDRATVLIDKAGIVRFAESVGPSGRRNIDELLARATEINAQQPRSAPAAAPDRGALAEDATLYVREGCRFCGSVLRAAANLRCDKRFRVRDVTKDPSARRDLDALAGPGAKVPALVQGGRVLQESADIVKLLASHYERC